MKKIIFLLFLFSTFTKAQNKEAIQVNMLLDNWHKAAADAKFDDYMNAMTFDAIYIGTDATENWNKSEFMKFAKPYFDKGKAWSFTALERHIYFSKDKKTAWFDELLDTQMKICRGSGVLVKRGNNWKIQHYVLSMTIPNDNSNEVINIKQIIENPLIEKLKK
ncbi:nuclear transport factor 2 family protein [Flavobacterium sp.]|uniref:nuclear transport factor 2 family protein n=1 Tax=Flavobacterium sp. TaxID=239 RepID=UPI003750806E